MRYHGSRFIMQGAVKSYIHDFYEALINIISWQKNVEEWLAISRVRRDRAPLTNRHLAPACTR